MGGIPNHCLYPAPAPRQLYGHQRGDMGQLSSTCAPSGALPGPQRPPHNSPSCSPGCPRTSTFLTEGSGASSGQSGSSWYPTALALSRWDREPSWKWSRSMAGREVVAAQGQLCSTRVTSCPCASRVGTFEGGLQDGSGFLGQEELLGIFVEGPALLGGHNELADEASPVADVVILVVLGQVEHVLGQQLALHQGAHSGLAFSSHWGN